jgi:drug/metabolite transporter (DMT)-like permease
MLIPPWLWIVFTVTAAGGQTLRNAMQKELIGRLGTIGATHVRFLFGLPFALLFLGIVRVGTGAPLPPLNAAAFSWTLFGALAQIVATGLMLAAMRERSFVVTTALTKIEPVWVALLGLVFLGDRLSLGLTTAILIATGGVLVMSWPRRPDRLGADGAGGGWSWRPALLGIAAGGLFGLAAIGFRGGIQALAAPSFFVGATTILALALAIQTASLSLYLLWRERETLVAILRAWRPSLFAGFMGAFASQFWFLAFAIETAARVRTLALVEILFAQLLSRRLFSQHLAPREALGIAAIVTGVILLLNL